MPSEARRETAMNSWLAECRSQFNSTGARRLLRMFGIAQHPRFAEVCAVQGVIQGVRHINIQGVIRINKLFARSNVATVSMGQFARRMRVQYSDTIYHLMSLGNGRQSTRINMERGLTRMAPG